MLCLCFQVQSQYEVVGDAESGETKHCSASVSQFHSVSPLLFLASSFQHSFGVQKQSSSRRGKMIITGAAVPSSSSSPPLPSLSPLSRRVGASPSAFPPLSSSSAAAPASHLLPHLSPPSQLSHSPLFALSPLISKRMVHLCCWETEVSTGWGREDEIAESHHYVTKPKGNKCLVGEWTHDRCSEGWGEWGRKRDSGRRIKIVCIGSRQRRKRGSGGGSGEGRLSRVIADVDKSCSTEKKEKGGKVVPKYGFSGTADRKRDRKWTALPTALVYQPGNWCLSCPMPLSLLQQSLIPEHHSCPTNTTTRNFPLPEFLGLFVAVLYVAVCT